MGDVVKLVAGRSIARASLPKPKACKSCEEPIETARLQVMPTARRCISCERALDKTVLRALTMSSDRDTIIIKG